METLSLINVLNESKVKIVCPEVFGSGVIYITPNQQCYIFTAKHCVCKLGKGCNGECSSNCNQIYECSSVEIEFDPTDLGNPTKFTPQKIIHSTNNDFAILEVTNSCFPTSFLKRRYKVSLLHKPYAAIEKLTYSFRGYPQAYQANNDSLKLDVHLNRWFKGIPSISVKALTDIEKTDNEDMIDGMSGSGIFLEHQNQIVLVGIITDKKASKNYFGVLKGLDFSFLDKLVRENRLPKIPILSQLPTSINLKEVTRYTYKKLVKFGREAKKQNKWNEATQYFNKAFERKSTFVQKESDKVYVGLFDCAKHLQKNGQWDEAEIIYNKLSKLFKATHEKLIRSRLRTLDDWGLFERVENGIEHIEKKQYELEGDKMLFSTSSIYKHEQLHIVKECFLNSKRTNTYLQSNYLLDDIDLQNAIKIDLIASFIDINNHIFSSSTWKILDDIKRNIENISNNAVRKKLLKELQSIEKHLYQKLKELDSQKKDYDSKSSITPIKPKRNFVKDCLLLITLSLLFIIVSQIVNEIYFRSDTNNVYVNNRGVIDYKIRSYTIELLDNPQKIELFEKLKKLEKLALQNFLANIEAKTDGFNYPIGKICEDKIQLIQRTSTGLFGYINEHGEIIIYPKYDKAFTNDDKLPCCFSNGVGNGHKGAKVQIDNRYFYINKDDICNFNCRFPVGY